MTDLEELAKLAVSARRVLVAVLLVVMIGFGGALVLGNVPVETLERFKAVLIIAVFVGAVAAVVLAMRIRTPPAKFPTIRVLIDRADQVAFIVELSRGNPFLALTDAEGRLLAAPLRLKGSISLPSRNMDAPNADEASQSGRAAAIARGRCPKAALRTIRDDTGLTSLAKLARKAVRG